ncbi:MAG TPA: thermonuclease family protein [Candidatus Omnitrophota bacterium]|nr:thermonuclease family protein [Candidatus Omnitrophota bacterium]
MYKKTLLTLITLHLVLATANLYVYAQNRTLITGSASKEQARIESLIDSATVRLVDGRKIRMIGLVPVERPRTKEVPRNEYNIIIEKEDPIISFEEIVYDTLREMLTGQDILLEFDALYRDRQGYILGYIFLKDGTFVNAEILRQGISNLTITPPNTKYKNELRAAYLEAKKEKRGLQGN